MMIDRYHLRYFLAVIDRGNFSKAAAACNVSQPTLSVGIAKMEKALGKPLFLRTSRRVELTAAGAALAATARQIEAGFAQVETAVAGAAEASVIRIGVLVTTPARWLDDFLEGMRGGAAAHRIEIVEGRERDLGERLARGRIDLALTILRPSHAGHAQEPLHSEGYSVAMTAAHPLASRRQVTAGELLTETMIVRRQCELLSDTSRWFTSRGVRPFFAARTMSEERAVRYVRAGLGVTIVPDSYRADGLALVPLHDFDFRRSLGIVYAPHTAHADAASKRVGLALAASIRGGMD